MNLKSLFNVNFELLLFVIKESHCIILLFFNILFFLDTLDT